MEVGETLKEIVTGRRKENEAKMTAIAEGKISDLETSDFHQHSTRFIRDLRRILKDGIKIVERPYISLYPVQHTPWSGEATIIIKNQPNALPGGKQWELVVEKDIPPDQIVGIGLFFKDWFGREKFNAILGITRKVWRVKPENAVPIYDLGDRSLLWPKRMTYQEIVQTLESKQP